VLLDKAIAGCTDDGSTRSQPLGRTLGSWRTEILEHHNSGASNGPTEGLTLKSKRCGQGFRSLEHHRLRVLLHAGGVTWPTRPQSPRIRTRTPHSFACPLTLGPVGSEWKGIKAPRWNGEEIVRLCTSIVMLQSHPR
jgi:Transposase